MAEARFAGMLEYLAALKRNKLTSEPSKLDALFQACMLDIENAPPIAMGSGTSILKMLAEADVPENWRHDLSNLVQKKVQAGIGAEGLKPKAEKKTQHCENLGFKKADVKIFPGDPAELPPDHLRRAYGQQMPVQCQVDE